MEELNNQEFMCLVIRECNTKSWSEMHTTSHRSVCRFCQGILHSARELREANLMIAEDGGLVPRLQEPHPMRDNVSGGREATEPTKGANMNHLFTETHCEICGDAFTDHDPVAEMYDPDDPHTGSLIVHHNCGLNRDWEIA